MKRLNLLFFISIISINTQIICWNDSAWVSSSDSTSSYNDRSYLHDPFASLNTKSRDYYSKRAYSDVLKNNMHLNYQQKIVFEKLEKLYGITQLKKYYIEFEYDDFLQRYNSSLTLKPKDIIVQEATLFSKKVRDQLNYYELGLDTQYSLPSNLNYAQSGLFYEPENEFTIFKLHENYRPNRITKYLFSYKKIFSMFTNFKQYESTEHIEDLRMFSCFDKFMKSFDEKLNTDKEFKDSLLDMDNGQEVIQFIKAEAQRIRQQDQQTEFNRIVSFKSSSQGKYFIHLKTFFSNGSNKSDCSDRIAAIDKIDADHNDFKKTNVFKAKSLQILDKLEIDSDDYETFTGNHLQHQLNKESINIIDQASNLWEQYTTPEFRELIEKAVLTTHLSHGLNVAGKLLEAAEFNDAAKAILAVSYGIDQRYRQFGTDIKEFFRHPIDNSLNKCDEIATSMCNAIVSVTRACAFLLGNAPASHGIPTPYELKKLDNIDLGAQKLQKACDVVNKYLNNTSTEQKLQDLGYASTGLLIDFATSKLSLNVLSSTKKATVKAVNTMRDKSLKQFGKIGDRVSKLTSNIIDKGVKATETLLDAAKKQPELITAEGGLFNFVEKELEKDSKFATGFKEIAKDVAKAEKIIEKFNPQKAEKFLTKKLIKPNGKGIGKDHPGAQVFNRTLPGDEKTAREFFDNLVNGSGMSDLVVERTAKDGGKLLVADKPGFGSISFRLDTKSGPPGIGINIPKFRGIVQKIKFVKE